MNKYRTFLVSDEFFFLFEEVCFLKRMHPIDGLAVLEP